MAIISAISAILASMVISWLIGPNNGSGNVRKSGKITTFSYISVTSLGATGVFWSRNARKVSKSGHFLLRKWTTFLSTGVLLGFLGSEKGAKRAFWSRTFKETGEVLTRNDGKWLILAPFMDNARNDVNFGHFGLWIQVFPKHAYGME